jgi:hydrogenase nickel incorporation protein HypA/HybF
MHELSLANAVVGAVLRHAAGRRVVVVSLRVGRLRQVVPDTLEFYFTFAAQGTVCEGARLEQEAIAARLRCRACGVKWELVDPAFRCPSCGGTDVGVTGGEELEVRSIEVEEMLDGALGS